jgi:hypothetical protein
LPNYLSFVPRLPAVLLHIYFGRESKDVILTRGSPLRNDFFKTMGYGVKDENYGRYDKPRIHCDGNPSPSQHSDADHSMAGQGVLNVCPGFVGTGSTDESLCLGSVAHPGSTSHVYGLRGTPSSRRSDLRRAPITDAQPHTPYRRSQTLVA